MFVDVEHIGDREYLVALLALNLTGSATYRVLLKSVSAELEKIMPIDEVGLAIDQAEERGLISISKPVTAEEIKIAAGDRLVGLTFTGIAVLINFPEKYLNRISERYGEIPENLTATLIPYLDLTRVPAADRYVSTADNLPEFKQLAGDLETIKNEIVRDQNKNELPIKEKRAIIAEIEGLVSQIRGGFVRISDLTNRARPLLKSLAEVCKDITVIAVAATSALAAIKAILAALF